MLAAGGIIARVALAACSVGSNDAVSFCRFGKEVGRYGVVGTYVADPLFNHPPLVGGWAWFATWAARGFHGTLYEIYCCSLILKLPVLASEALAAWLLWRIWRPKVGPARAAAIAAAFAWSLDSILVSAFHCNSDALYAVLCLAAACVIQDRRAYFFGGVLLAAAINVKIIPVLLIPPLLLSASNRREALSLLLGLSIGVVPFIPTAWAAAPYFARNVLEYNSSVAPWGPQFFLALLQHGGDALAAPAQRLIDAYHSGGRYLLFALIGLWAFAARARRQWNAYELAAVTFGLFLVIAPGFGMQYTAIVVPLLFAIRPRLAFAYATAAGAFLGIVYWQRLVPGIWPAISLFKRGEGITILEGAVGLVAWAILASFLLATTRRKAQTEAAPSVDLPAPERLLAA